LSGKGGAKPYKVGYRFEKLCEKKLKEAGYAVTRRYASKGLWDLHASRGCKTLLVQAKKGGYMSPHERRTLVDYCTSVGCIPVMGAYVRPTRFYLVEYGGTKEEISLNDARIHPAPQSSSSTASVQKAAPRPSGSVPRPVGAK
jgi:Holliday junction resolvase